MKLFLCAALVGILAWTFPGRAVAGETVEIHGILEETTTGVILVTDASSYVLRGIDASGLNGRRAIVLGDQGRDNGVEFIDAMEIKIPQ